MRLSSQDASFLYQETASGPMHGPGVTVIEGELPFEKLREQLASRLHRVPMYRKRLAFVPFNLGHPRWVDDPDFSLANHLSHHVLPRGSTLEQATEKALEVAEPLLDRQRPLWKMALIEGVPDRTVLMYANHHAMIDGAASIDLSTVLFDFEPDATPPAGPEEPWQPEPLPAPGELLGAVTRERMAELARPSPLAPLIQGVRPDAMELLLTANAVVNRLMTVPVIQAPWNAAPVGPKRRLAWTTHPLDDFRAIRAGLGGTINDVACTVVTEAAARYLRDHIEKPEGQYLRLMCPVNVRREDDTGMVGNRVSAIFPAFPAWPMDLAERHAHVMREVGRAKEQREAQAFELLLELNPGEPVNMAQTLLVGTPFDPTALPAQFPAPLPPRLPLRPPHFGFNFALTNIPGVRVPQYLAGHRILEGAGGPPLTGTLGLSVAVGSYAQQITVSLQSEARLMPDVAHLRDLVADVFGEFVALAIARRPKRKTTRRRAPQQEAAPG